MKIKIYIEGGGDSPEQNDLFREAWSSFFSKAGLSGKMVRPIRGKGRARTFDLFSQAVATRQRDEVILLLVDSEALLQPGHTPWQHLRSRRDDAWVRPARAAEDDAFLMVACMETWLMADRETLQRFFPGFLTRHLPQWPHLERVEKQTVFDALRRATARSRTPYAKGEVSFKLLKEVRPAQVEAACPSAARLLNFLRSL